MERQDKLFNIDPHQLFRIDGMGALITALIHLFLVAGHPQWFGFPRTIAYYSAGLALLYSIFSFYCYFTKVRSWRTCLKIISTANLGFCILISTILFIFHSDITTVGWLFFIAEIMVIVILAICEYQVSIQ